MTNLVEKAKEFNNSINNVIVIDVQNADDFDEEKVMSKMFSIYKASAKDDKKITLTPFSEVNTYHENTILGAINLYFSIKYITIGVLKVSILNIKLSINKNNYTKINNNLKENVYRALRLENHLGLVPKNDMQIINNAINEINEIANNIITKATEFQKEMFV